MPKAKGAVARDFKARMKICVQMARERPEHWTLVAVDGHWDCEACLEKCIAAFRLENHNVFSAHTFFCATCLPPDLLVLLTLAQM